LHDKELRMQRLKLVLAALVALPLVAAGCGRRNADTRGNEGTVARTESGAPAAQGSMAGTEGTTVALGKSLSPDGDVTSNTTAFHPGDPVFAEIQASQLTPGSSVRLSWVSPQGATVSTDDIVVPPDARVITLKAKDTSGWTPGTYRVDVAVGGASVASQTFTIGNDQGAAD
jgi:hypothetical protein